MEPEDLLKQFLSDINKRYAHNRKLFRSEFTKRLTPAPRAVRGRSHTGSSQCEDIFAQVLAYKLKDVKCVHIDYNLKYKFDPKERAKLVFPDITLIKEDGWVSDLIDMKLDTGWNREGMKTLFEKNEQDLKGLRSFAKKQNGLDATKEDKTSGRPSCCCPKLIIDEQTRFHVVVVTESNGGDFGKKREVSKDYQDKGMFLYSLSSGKHLNNYSDKKKGHFVLHNYEFKRLLENLGQGREERETLGKIFDEKEHSNDRRCMEEF